MSVSAELNAQLLLSRPRPEGSDALRTLLAPSADIDVSGSERSTLRMLCSARLAGLPEDADVSATEPSRMCLIGWPPDVTLSTPPDPIRGDSLL